MHYRKITIDNKIWQYFIGRYRVVILSPEGEKHVAKYSSITGQSWPTIERGIEKKYFHITPKQIAQYIKDGKTLTQPNK
jgi:hypothetical protein